MILKILFIYDVLTDELYYIIMGKGKGSKCVFKENKIEKMYDGKVEKVGYFKSLKIAKSGTKLTGWVRK